MPLLNFHYTEYKQSHNKRQRQTQTETGKWENDWWIDRLCKSIRFVFEYYTQLAELTPDVFAHSIISHLFHLRKCVFQMGSVSLSSRSANSHGHAMEARESNGIQKRWLISTHRFSLCCRSTHARDGSGTAICRWGRESCPRNCCASRTVAWPDVLMGWWLLWAAEPSDRQYYLCLELNLKI